MNYNKQTVKDVPLSGKKVLLRCDFNVPQDKTTGEITSDKRIVAALPTIRYLLDHGAAVIACSHLGKPKGTWKESLTLAPVAKRLTELLGMDVLFAKDIVGENAKTKAAALQPGQLLLQVLVIVRPQVGKIDLRCHFVILTFVDSIFMIPHFPRLCYTLFIERRCRRAHLVPYRHRRGVRPHRQGTAARPVAHLRQPAEPSEIPRRHYRQRYARHGESPAPHRRYPASRCV